VKRQNWKSHLLHLISVHRESEPCAKKVLVGDLFTRIRLSKRFEIRVGMWRLGERLQLMFNETQFPTPAPQLRLTD
jgi:hypothetical protein